VKASIEFQKRRSAVRPRVALWALGVVPIFVVLPLAGTLQNEAPTLFLALVLPLGALAFYAGFRMVRIINDQYRCPSCGKLVTEGDGIALNPTSCPHCGVPLAS
jgi:hypothetical protein